MGPEPERARRERFARRAGQFALTPKQAEDLLDHVTHLEDEALLRLAISTGIRREDIVAIPLNGLDSATGRLTYHESKKKRTRTIVVGGRCLVTLQQHVHKLPRGTPWLFPSPRNPKNHMSGRAAYDVLQRWLAHADLPQRPFHALRATCVKLAQKKGWTIEEVMQLTGDSFRVIKEHYDVPSDEEMAAAARDRPIA